MKSTSNLLNKLQSFGGYHKLKRCWRECAAMDIKKLKKWERTRSKGKLRFVLINGVIKIGFTVATICLISDEKYRSPATGQISIFYIFIALLIFSICGYFCGLFFWRQNEWEYLIQKRKDKLTKLEEQT